jgi:hypothetical protein
MKPRLAGTVILVLVLVLIPGLASGEVLETESATSSDAFNPLTLFG